MKRMFCLVSLLALCACDRPKYDVQLDCPDGAYGQLLVDARVYDSHMDLVIKRLSRDVRGRAKKYEEQWRGDKSWLYNKIPLIDDTIKLSLPISDELPNAYEIPGKIKVALDHDDLTGGLKFSLWHVPGGDGSLNFGSFCQPVIYPIDVAINKYTAEQKNCMNYLDAQVVSDAGRIRVYDEKTDREMHIGESVWPEIFGKYRPYWFTVGQAEYRPDVAAHACDVAARLREYIAAHIDTEYIHPPKDAVRVYRGDEMTISCSDGTEVVILGE